MADDDSGDDDFVPPYMNFGDVEVSSDDEFGGLEGGIVQLIPTEIPLSDLQVEGRFPDENGWVEDDTPPCLLPFSEEDSATLNRDPGGTEANFFKLFMTDELIDLFVVETIGMQMLRLRKMGELADWKGGGTPLGMSSKFFLPWYC